MCVVRAHAVSAFQTASIRSLRPSETLVLSPAARRRKPILPIRFRKPTRPRRNQKARRQFFRQIREKSHCTGSGVKVSQRPSERIKVLSDGLLFECSRNIQLYG
ncbi:hypothetical protein NEIFLAOT_02168 [Neisseria flavescens NRL30031/H210]|uniref:Uncharacterized protein n=1 Tax=Neisseria flavescens NRL30031/H210 TaxID=546264 RepID=C0EQC6_NEIFL|nr:hypothetical protein NEIFLAOT_02168 [Neisseria flavescens NRL30031/H210]